MKKGFTLTVFLLALLLFGRSYAQQMPPTSSSENPVWYYVQVKGSDSSRENLVFTAESSEVHGRVLRNAVTGTNVEAQLWRFEDAGDGWFHIVSKVDAKKIDVAYDASRSIGYAALVETPASKFKLNGNNNTAGFVSIESALPAPGGSSSEVYFHQANTGGSRDYIIMLVGTDYGYGSNSAFAFVPFVDYNIEYSDATSETWYNIVSGKAGTNNLTVYDNSGQGDYPLSVNALENANTAQQWKVVKDAASDGVYLINRSTGSYIQPQSTVQGIFNLPKLSASATGTRTLEYIGNGQYTISGVEQDGVTRWLHLSSQDETPQEYAVKNAPNSAFAWYFLKVSKNTLGTFMPSTAPVKITVTDRRIAVDADDYTLRSISGSVLKKDSALPAGIYLVTVNDATVKVIVK
jgi:hypothetical protein